MRQRASKTPPSEESKSNAYRFRTYDKRIELGSRYVDYLFRVMEQYVGSAKVFTSISAALLALPFLQLKTLVIVCKMPCMAWLLGVAVTFLGVSIVTGAVYQLHSVQIVEDEVENEGEYYDWYLGWLGFEYRAMCATMLIGVVLLAVWLGLLVVNGDPRLLAD